MTEAAYEPCRWCEQSIIMVVTAKLRRVAVEPFPVDEELQDDTLVMLPPLPKTGYPEPRVVERMNRALRDDHVIVPADGTYWQRHLCEAKGGRRRA